MSFSTHVRQRHPVSRPVCVCTRPDGGQRVSHKICGLFDRELSFVTPPEETRRFIIQNSALVSVILRAAVALLRKSQYARQRLTGAMDSAYIEM